MIRSLSSILPGITLILLSVAPVIVAVGPSTSAMKGSVAEFTRRSNEASTPGMPVVDSGLLEIRAPAKPAVTRDISPEIMQTWEKAGLKYWPVEIDTFGKLSIFRFFEQEHKVSKLPAFLLGDSQSTPKKAISELPDPDASFAIIWGYTFDSPPEMPPFKRLYAMQINSLTRGDLKNLHAFPQLTSLEIDNPIS